VFFVQGRELDGNKLYASEILANSMQVQCWPLTVSCQALLGQTKFRCCEKVGRIIEMVLSLATCVHFEDQMSIESGP
jgi:hypothetical protein